MNKRIVLCAAEAEELISEIMRAQGYPIVSEVAIQQEVIPSVREGSGRAGRQEDVPPSRPDSSLRSE